MLGQRVERGEVVFLLGLHGLVPAVQASLVVHDEHGVGLRVEVDAVDDAVDARAAERDGAALSAELPLVVGRHEAFRHELLAFKAPDQPVAVVAQACLLQLRDGDEGSLGLGLGVAGVLEALVEDARPHLARRVGRDARDARALPQQVVEALKHQVAERAARAGVAKGNVEAVGGELAFVEPAQRAVDERLQAAGRPEGVGAGKRGSQRGVDKLEGGGVAPHEGRGIRHGACKLGERLFAHAHGVDVARDGQARRAIESVDVRGVVAIAVHKLLEQGAGSQGLCLFVGQDALHHHDVACGFEARAEGAAQLRDLAGTGRDAEGLPEARLCVDALA